MTNQAIEELLQQHTQAINSLTSAVATLTSTLQSEVSRATASEASAVTSANNYTDTKFGNKVDVSELQGAFTNPSGVLLAPAAIRQYLINLYNAIQAIS